MDAVIPWAQSAQGRWSVASADERERRMSRVRRKRSGVPVMCPESRDASVAMHCRHFMVPIAGTVGVVPRSAAR